MSVQTRVFTEPEEHKRSSFIELVFGPEAIPGSSEFLDGVSAFLDRLSAKHDLWYLVYPEQGDAPLVPNTYGRTHRSFDGGRWYTEVRARAVLAELGRNPDLRSLVFFQDDGVLLATPRAAGFTPKRVIQLLDRLPDQGTTQALLEGVAFCAWSVDLEFHVACSDARLLAAIKLAVRGEPDPS